jgi:hypothetical protein
LFKKSEPNEVAISASFVMSDPKNGLGDRFDAGRDYALIRPRDLARYAGQGYANVEIKEVLTDEGDENLVLVSRERKTA